MKLRARAHAFSFFSYLILHRSVTSVSSTAEHPAMPFVMPPHPKGALLNKTLPRLFLKFKDEEGWKSSWKFFLYSSPVWFLCHASPSMYFDEDHSAQNILRG